MKAKKKKNKVSKNIWSGVKAPSTIEYQNYCIDVHYTDKKKYSITKQMIEKLYNKALSLNKKPLLKVGIEKDNNEVFLLECKISLERK